MNSVPHLSTDHGSPQTDFPVVRYRFFRVSVVFWILCLTIALASAPVDGSTRSVATMALGAVLLGIGILGWFGERKSFLRLRRSNALLAILTLAIVVEYIIDVRTFSSMQQAGIALVFAAAATRDMRTTVIVAICTAGLPELAIYGLGITAAEVSADERSWIVFGWIPTTVLTAWTSAAIMASYDRAVASISQVESAREAEGYGVVETLALGSVQSPGLEDLIQRVADAPLTERQRAVVALLIEGRSNAQIASALDISVRTVQAHVRSALEITGAGNRTRLAVASAVANELAAAETFRR